MKEFQSFIKNQLQISYVLIYIGFVIVLGIIDHECKYGNFNVIYILNYYTFSYKKKTIILVTFEIFLLSYQAKYCSGNLTQQIKKIHKG